MKHFFYVLRGRRGYVYTTAALLIVIIAVSLAAVEQSNQRSQTRGSLDYILSADAFLTQLEDDLSRVLRITGYRALIGMEQHIASEGMYIANISKAFVEAATNGSINGTAYEVLEGSTLRDVEQRMIDIADDIGLSLNLTLSNVSINHSSPFVLIVRAQMTVVLTTADGTTRWNYSSVQTSSFPIADLRDPVYTVETLGRVPITVKESNVTRPYITSSNDTTNLQLLWNNSMYINDSSAPSFLMRFAGNLSASPFGIASLVDVKALESQSLAVYTDRSVVDYLYFGGSPTSTNQIVNMPTEFKLDDDHLENYDAEDKVS